MFTEIIFLALVAVATCHDIAIGTNTNGRKIFDETKQANPAIWRQTNNVTVTANDDEVISRIVIKDLRPEKDGDVKIVEGGEGQKNVTIELKSPTALRGYDFKVEVYAAPDTNTVSKDSKGMRVNEDGLSKDAEIPMDKIESKISPITASKDDSNRDARNLMKDIEPSSTVLPEVTVEDFNKENMKISKDAQDHETVDFVLNDSAKEDLKAESMTLDLPVEINHNDTDVTSTTEYDENTTHFKTTNEDNKYESTTLPENDKFGKIEPINDGVYTWNHQSFKDPQVGVKENEKVQNDNSKFSGL